MSLTFLLSICAICTILGLTLSYLLWDIKEGPDAILEMDYDPEDECIVCGERCDNYEHWTQGG